MELVITAAISLIIVSVVGVLLVGGQRFWLQTYSDSQKQIKLDAQAIMIEFGNMGRRSNRISSGVRQGYKIYTNYGDTTPAPTDSSTLIATGNAAEFGYWNYDWDAAGFDWKTVMDQKKPCTDYVEFYLAGSIFKAEYGIYAYDSKGVQSKVPARTEILAQNASAGTTGMGVFSHTTDKNGNGNGCVRISLKLTDPSDGEVITIKTATLLRVIWPR